MIRIISIILFLFTTAAGAVDQDDPQIVKIKEKFELRAQKEKEEFVSCVSAGTNAKTCVDPHWCLYPNKLDTNECTWYRTKYGL